MMLGVTRTLINTDADTTSLHKESFYYSFQILYMWWCVLYIMTQFEEKKSQYIALLTESQKFLL